MQELRQWRKAAYLQNESPDLPIQRFVERYGYTPPGDWLLGACFGKRHSGQRQAAFMIYLQQHSQESRWAESWIAHHQRLEFGTAIVPVVTSAEAEVGNA